MPTRMVGHPSTDSNQNTRQQRNLAEKQRRDKLNGYINELANIVPLVSMSSKRLDKTSILRLSAAFLRIHNSSLCSAKKRSASWKSHFLNSENLRDLLEAVDGFLIVTNGAGKVVYVSQSVERFLGHQHIEMIGHSIFSFIHPSDLEFVQHHFQSLTVSLSHSIGSRKMFEKCSFFCRLRERHQPRSEVITYQLVHITGHMTFSQNNPISNDESFEGMVQPSDLMLKAFVRVVQSNPYTELSLSDAFQDEYVTRHSLDGTIIFADHRLSTITGHLPHEVCGVSAYEYILKQDMSLSLFAHKLMFASNSGCGIIVYRLRTKSEGFVFLRSNGYLQYDKTTGQVEQFICINRLLPNEEGEEEMRKFREKFTPHINNCSPTMLYKAIQTVQKLGLKVLCNEEEKSLSGTLSPTFSEEDLPGNGIIHVTRLAHPEVANGSYHASTLSQCNLNVQQLTSSSSFSDHESSLSPENQCRDNYPELYSGNREPYSQSSSFACQELHFPQNNGLSSRGSQESASDVNRVVSSAMNSLISNSAYDDESSTSLSNCSAAKSPCYGCEANVTNNCAPPENASYGSGFHLTDLSESVVHSSTYEPLLHRCQFSSQSNPSVEEDHLFPGNKMPGKLPGEPDLSLNALSSDEFVPGGTDALDKLPIGGHLAADNNDQYFVEDYSAVNEMGRDHLMTATDLRESRAPNDRWCSMQSNVRHHLPKNA